MNCAIASIIILSKIQSRRCNEWWNCFQDKKQKESSRTPFAIGDLSPSPQRIGTSTNKKNQGKSQKQARQKNRSKKKKK
jgi:hypothetical protein